MGGKGIQVSFLNDRIPLPPIPLPAVRPWLLSLSRKPRSFLSMKSSAKRSENPNDTSRNAGHDTFNHLSDCELLSGTTPSIKAKILFISFRTPA